MNQDLGKGNIKSLFIKLAIPAVCAQIINLMYNIVDRIYIGHIPDIGAYALTGVGLFAPILMLLNAFATLVGSSGAPLAAIEMGKQNNEKANHIMGNCFSLLILFSILLTILFSIFCPYLLTIFGASKNTLPYALDYAHIYILGSVFVLIVLGMNPFISTQGFSKISMMTTMIGALINLVLDPVFIFGFHMGVKGAALATVLSQSVGALWILKFLTGKKTILKLQKKNLILNTSIFIPCLYLGISPFIMVSTESLLSICFTSSLSFYGGDVAVGAMTIITSLAQLVNMPLQGICQGAQPLISYNYGAGNKERVRKAFFTAFKTAIVFTFSFWILIQFFPKFFVSIFSSNQELIQYASWSLRIYMACIFSTGFQNSCQQSFLALGQAKVSIFLAILRKIVLLIPLIYILPYFFSNKVFAIFLAEPVSDCIAAFITTLVFMKKFDRILDLK
ncbi:MATE family efflux transporter [Floccifex sp.]|uniref:MATE family efflux transporter n=1 Tax=Floccifex sp. TaxID=2815810 RepID=UPI003F0B67BC